MRDVQETAVPYLSDQELGRALKHERIDRGWSLAEAAERMGISKSSLDRYEKGAPMTFGALQLAVRGLGYSDVPTFLNSVSALRVRLIPAIA
jgi:transcriptional regulator with XRE-family HTH domain